MDSNSRLWVPKQRYQINMTLEEIEIDDYYRDVRSMLNKLTPQKFKVLLKSFLELSLDSKFKTEKLADFILRKAVAEPLYSEVYARFCASFITHMNSKGHHHCTKWFQMHLIKECNSLFHEVFQCKEDDCVTKHVNRSRKEWKEIERKQYLFGTMIFIGQLYKVDLIREKVILHHIAELMTESKTSNYERKLECLCKLLRTAGKKMDEVTELKTNNNELYAKIEQLMNKGNLCARVKFALLDLVELRKVGWIKDNVYQETPTTIDAIRSPTGG